MERLFSLETKEQYCVIQENIDNLGFTGQTCIFG